MPERWGLTKNNGGIFLGGVSLQELADVYGTPLHVVNEKRLKQNAYQFTEAFQKAYSQTKVFFSYKTNNIPGILKKIHECGIAAEAISPYELLLALKLGVHPQDIIYNGIIKPSEGLEIAIKNMIRVINIDCPREVGDIQIIAERLRKIVNVGLRLCPSEGWNAQFGVPIKDGAALEVLKKIKESPNLKFVGFLIHAGTSARSADIYLKFIETILQFSSAAKKKLGLEVKFIDLGGGFGAPYSRNMTYFEAFLNRIFGIGFSAPSGQKYEPIISMADRISKKIRENCSKLNLNLPELHLEPGRVISSDAQMMLIRVFDIKRNNSKKIVVTDGGRYNNTFPLSFEIHSAFNVNKPSRPANEVYQVVGRICSPGDWVFQKIRFPELRVGDLIAIMDTGAYFTSYSNNFSFPRPAVISVSEGRVEVLRERETFEYMTEMDKKGLPQLGKL